jgi:hypothetical protein
MEANNDINLLVDIAVMTPIALLTATGKKVPDLMLAAALVYTGVRATQLVTLLAKRYQATAPITPGQDNTQNG